MSRYTLRALRALTAVLVAVALLPGSATTAAARSDVPPTDVAPSDVPPTGEFDANVVGGRPATRYYPGLSALEYDSTQPPRDDHTTCTATLIDTEGTGWAQWGLTAAHCVTNPPSGTRTSDAPTDGQELHGPPLVVPVQDKNFQLRTGALDRTQVPALEIAAFVIPPWWQWIPDTAEPIETAPGADLALLRLAAPVRVPAATLASTEPRPGSTLTVVGWGRTSNGSAATPTTASQLTTAALPPERCAAAVITRHDVCTGNPGDQEKQFGACNGDSGGPLYGRSGDRWVLTALVSRASTPTCGISPDANTGIAYYRPWIEAVVHGTVRTDLPLTPAQGGPIPHPRIGFTTTDPVELPDRVAQSTS